MGLILSVSGGKLNFELDNYEIVAYEFSDRVENTLYAKSADNERYLAIKGNISKILESSPDTLEEIRKWATWEYEDSTYYNEVKITHIYRDEVLREITFPNAFLKHYEEDINTDTGHGYFTITLMQKADLRAEVVVEPFSAEFAEISGKNKDQDSGGDGEDGDGKGMDGGWGDEDDGTDGSILAAGGVLPVAGDKDDEEDDEEKWLILYIKKPNAERQEKAKYEVISKDNEGYWVLDNQVERLISFDYLEGRGYKPCRTEIVK